MYKLTLNANVESYLHHYFIQYGINHGVNIQELSEFLVETQPMRRLYLERTLNIKQERLREGVSQ